MLYETLGQYRVFLWMLAAGALIGAWYALCALARVVLSAGFWLGLLTDAAFGLGAAAIFCAALLTANYGRFRFYALAASALGFGLFAAAVYPPGRRAIRGALSIFRKFSVELGRYRWIKVIFR